MLVLANRIGFNADERSEIKGYLRAKSRKSGCFAR